MTVRRKQAALVVEDEWEKLYEEGKYLKLIKKFNNEDQIEHKIVDQSLAIALNEDCTIDYGEKNQLEYKKVVSKETRHDKLNEN